MARDDPSASPPGSRIFIDRARGPGHHLRPRAIAVLDTDRAGVADQAMFYVELTRARDNVVLLTDDREALIEALETSPAEQMSALRAIGEQFEVSTCAPRCRSRPPSRRRPYPGTCPRRRPRCWTRRRARTAEAADRFIGPRPVSGRGLDPAAGRTRDDCCQRRRPCYPGLRLRRSGATSAVRVLEGCRRSPRRPRDLRTGNSTRRPGAEDEIRRVSTRGSRSTLASDNVEIERRQQELEARKAKGARHRHGPGTLNAAFRHRFQVKSAVPRTSGTAADCSAISRRRATSRSLRVRNSRRSCARGAGRRLPPPPARRRDPSASPAAPPRGPPASWFASFHRPGRRVNCGCASAAPPLPRPPYRALRNGGHTLSCIVRCSASSSTRRGGGSGSVSGSTASPHSTMYREMESPFRSASTRTRPQSVSVQESEYALGRLRPRLLMNRPRRHRRT